MHKWNLGIDIKDIAITALVLLMAFVIWLDQSYQPENINEIREVFEKNSSSTPPLEFYTDGCTLWFDSVLDYSLTRICIEHDFRYWRGGSLAEKERADLELRDKANSVLPYVGDIMYQGVKIFGHPIIPTPWRWGWGNGY